MRVRFGSSTVRLCRDFTIDRILLQRMDWLARLLASLPLKLDWIRRWQSHRGHQVEDGRAHPELRVYFDERDTGEEVVTGQRPYWLIGVHTARRFHLHVENSGHSLAMASSGTLERLESLDTQGEWHRQPGFDPLPLQWAGKNFATEVDLYPGTPRKLDIARVYKGGVNLQLVSPMLPSGAQRDYPPGTYRMTVTVTALTNGRTRAEGRFILEFGGDWDSVRIYEE